MHQQGNLPGEISTNYEYQESLSDAYNISLIIVF